MLKLSGDIILSRRFKFNNYVVEGFKINNSLVYRTLGLKDIIGYELEYNLSLHPTEVLRITDYILPIISNGFEIKDKLVTSELTGAPVMLLLVEPKYKYRNGEKVLRIIFSDEDYKLPNQLGCSPNYIKQLY